MIQKMVSVIVPVFKCEKFIEKCIISVLEQDYQNFELLLILDGEDDSSGAICQKYAQKDSRIRVVQNRHGGVSVARNCGINIANGEWIVFVDSDDWIEKKCLSKLVSISDCCLADIVICSYYVEIGKKIIPESFFNFSHHRFTKYEIDELLMNCMIPHGFGRLNIATNVGVPWAKLYRTKFIKDNNISFVPGLKRMQDMIFNLYAFISASKIVFNDVKLYHYVKHSNASTSLYRKDFSESIVQINRELIKFIDLYKKDNLKKVIYTKNILLIIEMIKLQYIPKEAHMKYIEKKIEIKEKLRDPILKESLKFYDKNFLTTNQKIAALFLKYNIISPIFIFLWIKHK